MTFAQTLLPDHCINEQQHDRKWLSSKLREFQTLLASSGLAGQRAIDHIQQQLDVSKNREVFSEWSCFPNCASPVRQQPSKLQHASVDAYLVQAITIAYSSCYPQAHDVMCAALAQAIDKKPLGMLRDALGKAASTSRSTSLSSLPQKSALTVLAAVHDLGKALQLEPSWQKLLRQPEAEAVYRPRLAAAAPLYAHLLRSLGASDGMTWQDAYASYTSVCDGTAPREQLQQLLQLSLETLALGIPQARLQLWLLHKLVTGNLCKTAIHLRMLRPCYSELAPIACICVRHAVAAYRCTDCLFVHAAQLIAKCVQHLGELTFFVTVLAALEANDSSTAAAEALYTATCTIRNQLQERLAAVMQSTPALGAVEHFTLLAQLRQLLSRCRELVHTLVAPDVQRAFLTQLAALQDETMVNFTVSDKALTFLQALPRAAVVASPLLSTFLSGPYANMLPQHERERLAVPQPMTSGALHVRGAVSVRCCGGLTVPIDLQLMQPLERLRDLVAIFARWQAQGTRGHANASGELLSPREPDSPPRFATAQAHTPIATTHSNVPLPVQPAVLRSILDCAFGVTMQPIIGGDAAKQQYLQSWRAEMLALPQQQAQAVLSFASLLGFDDCVQLLSGRGQEGTDASMVL